ncbi:OOP family OmpA-OmpF porin [Rhodovulum iodosum]|uniref:OOP family OmpA-OmpF porin n=1 Tax=Rhodovulum iodosum TaxID=68291 RepID=A0ABV3XUW1_9RHOB|nr:OmpA family protein [Rhodovulum robiginosum]RSK41014.1 OmpA family protein [Rhodovulum robiginosum]
MKKVLSIALVALLAGLPAAAQEMTDEELLELFETQRDTFRKAQESGMGRTRGLTLITVDDVEVSTEAPAMAAPGEETAEAGDVTVTTEAPSTGTRPPELKPLVPEATPVVFGELDRELQVNVRVQFAFDSAALSAEQKPKLDQLCRVMKASDIATFRIVGHTDASGSDAYNQRLSVLRAQEVQRYFINECGIAATRLEAVGMGERFLYNEDEPRAGENRRVEFQALS